MASGSPKSLPSKNQPPKFQAPKGTRDFYPQDLAVRHYIEGVWRSVSINHGFDEIDGPTIEHLDLYTHKSGPGIASELFQVFSGKDEEQVAAMRAEAGGLAPYALRPEFTPTLARMVAAKANSLPTPIKWFAIPSHFRAERPQRGRLREFMQWNVDFLGDDSPRADAEVIATAVAALQSLGLDSSNLRVKISSRQTIVDLLLANNLPEANVEAALILIDKRDRLGPEAFSQQCDSIGLHWGHFDSAMQAVSRRLSELLAMKSDTTEYSVEFADQNTNVAVNLGLLKELVSGIESLGIKGWVEVDLSIVRGLAYYTGTVFEIIADGERAIAGGGRYDNLIESFGGPPMPACGFGMGDVVLANLLHDKGLLKPEMEYLPRPHAFIIAANDEAAVNLPGIVTRLRRKGFHIRHSYKPTRHVGKLLGEANKGRALAAIILGDKLSENIVELKDLGSGQQRDLSLDDVPDALRTLIDRHAADA